MATKIELRNYAKTHNCSVAEAKEHFRKLAQDANTIDKLSIIGIRHTGDGGMEFFSAEFYDMPARPTNDKSSLLNHICCNDWVHNPPIDAVADYFLHTATYAEMNACGVNLSEYVLLINFHEHDPDNHDLYSCRQIQGAPIETKDLILDRVMEQASVANSKLGGLSFRGRRAA